MRHLHIVVRKVKNGRVKIGGNYYYPSKQFADPEDRFEGMKLAFGVYYDYHFSPEKIADFVSLWGTAELLRTPDHTQEFYEEELKKICDCRDGRMYLFWSWWHVKKV